MDPFDKKAFNDKGNVIGDAGYLNLDDFTMQSITPGFTMPPPSSGNSGSTGITPAQSTLGIPGNLAQSDTGSGGSFTQMVSKGLNDILNLNFFPAPTPTAEETRKTMRGPISLPDINLHLDSLFGNDTVTPVSGDFTGGALSNITKQPTLVAAAQDLGNSNPQPPKGNATLWIVLGSAGVLALIIGIVVATNKKKK